mmetsp:Transcript_44297/g.89443  ORF Transcript_44297/g.89443 Transcript_44297/m.89443 type:complete len:113 (-) Transcript_44297:383-721(-)
MPTPPRFTPWFCPFARALLRWGACLWLPGREGGGVVVPGAFDTLLRPPKTVLLLEEEADEIEPESKDFLFLVRGLGVLEEEVCAERISIALAAFFIDGLVDAVTGAADFVAD